jgi:general secretion pathway protein D
MDAIARATDVDYRPKPAGHLVKFNLQDADLAELVNHISGMTGRRFIYGAKVRQIKATVVSPQPVTLAEAYQAFLSILEMNGMTVIPHGRFLKIVDSGGVVTQATPLFERGEPVPEADRYVTRLYRLENAQAEEMAQLLGKFKSKEGDISVYAPGRLLIITDTGSQIRRMIRIIEEVDVGGGAGQRMWIEPVHHGAAGEMAKRINELFDVTQTGQPGQPGQPGAAGAGSGLSKVVADEQTNSLIIVGNEENYLKLLELMKRLDAQPSETGRVRVLPLQNATAEELANVLTQMLQGMQQKGQPGQPGAGGGTAGGMFEGELRVTADKATNSLIVTSSGRDYATMRLVVDKLDMPRRQVFIEAVIMDVSVDHSTRLGLSYHAGTNLGDAQDPTLLWGGLYPTNSIFFPPSSDQLQGLALGVRGPGIEGSTNLFGTGLTIPAFGVILNALATSGDANILATPHILATDNVPAEINVGENIPLQENVGGGGIPNIGNIAGLAGGQAGAAAAALPALLGGGGGFGFNTPRQDVGTKIKVTPHINENNQVRLEIEEEISERGATSGALGAVSITKRTANTTVIVDDQQTVVIGGLMRDMVAKSKKKIPVLGDLPVLGFLFRHSESVMRKTNLLLILTPYVVHDQNDLRKIFERKMQERQEFLDRYFVFTSDDWSPPKDYTRTNGLVEDVRQAYFEIEEQIRLEEESAPREQREHAPSAPIELPANVRERAGGAPATPAPAPAPAGAAPPQPRPPTPAQQRRRIRRAPPPNPPQKPRAQLDSPIRISPMARSVNVERVE